MKQFYIETNQILNASSAFQFHYEESADGDIHFKYAKDPATGDILTLEDIKKDAPDKVLVISTAHHSNAYHRVYLNP